MIRAVGIIAVILFTWSIFFLSIYVLISPFPLIFLVAFAFLTGIIAHVSIRLLPDDEPTS